MRQTILIIAGILGILMGTLWTLQGFGIVRWPAESFMIDQREWAVRGGVLIVASAIVIAAVRMVPTRAEQRERRRAEREARRAERNR